MGPNDEVLVALYNCFKHFQWEETHQVQGLTVERTRTHELWHPTPKSPASPRVSLLLIALALGLGPWHSGAIHSVTPGAAPTLPAHLFRRRFNISDNVCVLHWFPCTSSVPICESFL